MSYVQGAQGISVDPRQIMMQSQHNPVAYATESGFDKALGMAGGFMQMFGPVGGLLAQKFGGPTGAAITGSVLSGFAGPGGGFSTPGMGGMAMSPYSATTPGGGVSYGPNKALAMPGAPPGYPGGGQVPGAPPGFPGGGQTPGMNMNANVDAGQFDGQINSMMNNNLMFLAIQTKVQNVSQTTQLMSNIFKADSDAKLNAIRNVRA